MAKVLYTAEAKVTGGARPRTCAHERRRARRADPPPQELGGEGGGTNPEQLFAAGFASCFESAATLVAARKKLEAGDIEIASKVILPPHRGARLRLAVKWTSRCHRSTTPRSPPTSSAPPTRSARTPTRRAGNIDVDFTVNGQPLDG